MISFFVSLILLILGYFTYGKLTERNFGPDDRPAPAITHNDGVDFMPISTPRAFLIQLLDIAGLGPIYGAILGALWGPAVFIWIVLGCIFGGAVHDYMVGMTSMRQGGATIDELTGEYMGPLMRDLMRVFCVVLLILLGTTFTTGPATLLAMLTPETLDFNFWLAAIIVYYLLATVLPIDKLIGRIYPLFAICLIVMALGVMLGILTGDYTIPEITLRNLHPEGTPLWPVMFISVACGAVSGFHATQSPLMARCINSERQGRRVFYGAMIAEGVIALIWAAVGCAFYNGTAGLNDALNTLGGQGPVVYDITSTLMPGFGMVLAMLGVIICPISSGDTAFRSARLVLAGWLKVDQRKLRQRLYFAVPMMLIVCLLRTMDITILWRYFSWSNQTLAMIVLWTASMYLLKTGRDPWMTVIPATFMSNVTFSYILIAEEGLLLSPAIAYPAGAAFSVICFIWFLRIWKRERGKRL